MDPWDHIRRAVADARSGSLAIAARAAEGLAEMPSRRDVVRAGRALVRAHPAMALVRRLTEDAAGGGDARAFAERARAESSAAADAVRWIVTRRGSVVVTHSSSGAVASSLERVRHRIGSVRCTASLPGGEGRAFARRLERAGFTVTVIADATIARGCAEADVVLVGADAVTPDGILNKVGTHPLALVARDAGVGCYAVACGSKMLPTVPDGFDARFELTPLHLFDSIVTERGALRPASVRRAAGRVVVTA